MFFENHLIYQLLVMVANSLNYTEDDFKSMERLRLKKTKKLNKRLAKKA